jgi:hypothetical protein
VGSDISDEFTNLSVCRLLGFFVSPVFTDALVFCAIGLRRNSCSLMTELKQIFAFGSQ